jgi:hypothetical protein
VSLSGLMLLGGFGRASAAGVRSVSSPEQLFHDLMATPFRPSELPAGFRMGDPSNPRSGLQRVEPGIPGLVGGAVLELRGPELTDTIWYYVYESEAAALDHFENGKFGRTTTSQVPPGTDLEQTGPTASGSTTIPGGPSARLTEAYEPAEFDVPAWCVAAKAVNWAWTSCQTVSGYVEVVGYSAIQAGRGAQRGDDANAIALAQAALAHLNRLA